MQIGEEVHELNLTIQMDEQRLLLYRFRLTWGLSFDCKLNFELLKTKKEQSLGVAQGYNARNVILKVYTSLVLQCTISGR